MRYQNFSTFPNFEFDWPKKVAMKTWSKWQFNELIKLKVGWKRENFSGVDNITIKKNGGTSPLSVGLNCLRHPIALICFYLYLINY